MSYNDKRELCRDVADLRGTGHMTKILKIIACQLPHFIGEVIFYLSIHLLQQFISIYFSLSLSLSV